MFAEFGRLVQSPCLAVKKDALFQARCCPAIVSTRTERRRCSSGETGEVGFNSVQILQEQRVTIVNRIRWHNAYNYLRDKSWLEKIPEAPTSPSSPLVLAGFALRFTRFLLALCWPCRCCVWTTQCLAGAGLPWDRERWSGSIGRHRLGRSWNILGYLETSRDI